MNSSVPDSLSSSLSEGEKLSDDDFIVVVDGLRRGKLDDRATLAFILCLRGVEGVAIGVFLSLGGPVESCSKH